MINNSEYFQEGLYAIDDDNLWRDTTKIKIGLHSKDKNIEYWTYLIKPKSCAVLECSTKHGNNKAPSLRERVSKRVKNSLNRIKNSASSSYTNQELIEFINIIGWSVNQNSLKIVKVQQKRTWYIKIKINIFKKTGSLDTLTCDESDSEGF